MIYNLFPFFNELDLLEIRLNELWNVVDRFILVESNKTFSGLAKLLHYADNQMRFIKFWSKITPLLCSGFEGNPWEMEAYQRNFLAAGLVNMSPDDVVILSDADEIPKAETVKNLKIEHGEIIHFHLQHSYYYFNVIVPGNFGWSRATTYKTFLSIGSFEQFKNYLYTKAIDNAGWHFAYLGGAEKIKEKINAFSHQEFNKYPYNELDYLENHVKGSRDYITGKEMVELESLDSLPRYVRNNLQKFIRYFHDRTEPCQLKT